MTNSNPSKGDISSINFIYKLSSVYHIYIRYGYSSVGETKKIGKSYIFPRIGIGSILCCKRGCIKGAEEGRTLRTHQRANMLYTLAYFTISFFKVTFLSILLFGKVLLTIIV